MANKTTRTPEDESTNFYEAMPMAMNGSHYIYRDDIITEPTQQELDNTDGQIRRVAIAILVLVALAAIGMGVLLYQGLQAAHDTFQPLNGAQQTDLEL